jgi:hypothetical protein
MDVTTTYDRDEDGLIIRAGARWGESRPTLERFAISLLVMSMFATLIGLVYLPVLGWGLIGLLVVIVIAFYIPPAERALYFSNDGRMLTPHGIFYRPELEKIGGHHDHIVSIEARMQHDQPNRDEPNAARMYEVILISNGGDLIVMSRNLFEQDALKVAAQLNHALNRIRKERAESGMIEHEGAWVTLN